MAESFLTFPSETFSEMGKYLILEFIQVISDVASYGKLVWSEQLFVHFNPSIHELLNRRIGTLYQEVIYLLLVARIRAV